MALGDPGTIAGTVYGTIGQSSRWRWRSGATDLLAHRAAVQLTLWLGVAVLAAQGIRYARLERLSPSSTIVTIGLNLAIGLALVALEVLIAH